MRRGPAWLLLLVVLLATGGGAVVQQRPACACECLPTTPAEARSDADVIFVGTPRRALGKIDPDDPSPVTYVFSLERIVKGPPRRGPTIQVQTSASSAACGIAFQFGRRYEVYAVNSGGILFALVCGGTHQLTQGDPGPTPSRRPTPALSATPSARHAETLPPRPVSALLSAARVEPAAASEATEGDPQMPVEGFIAAGVIICVLLVAIALVSRRRN